MKVLMVSSDANSTSGACMSMVYLAKELKKIGVHPIIVLPKRGTIEELLRNFNIEYTIIHSCVWIEKNRKRSFKKWIEILFKAIYNIVPIIRLKYFMEKYNIDIVHINTSYTYVGAYASLLLKIPFVWHIRELLEEDQDVKMWSRRLGYSLIDKANVSIAISNNVFEKYRSILQKTELKMIYNGIDPSNFYMPERSIFTSSVFNMAISGRISESKGQIELIKALGKLYKEGIENFHLYIVGTGDDYDVKELHNTIKREGIVGKISLLGFRKDVYNILSNIDIVFVCSRAEAFGRVTVEAMLSGCLVIGTNSGGTSELIEDRLHGLLYEPGNIDDLCNKVKIVMKDIDKARYIAKLGRERAYNGFTASKNANAIKKVYEEVLRLN